MTTITVTSGDTLNRAITFERPTVKIRVNIKYDGKCLSITGDIYEPTSYGSWRDVGGGQCYDQLIADFPKDKKAVRLYQIWTRWHLNDMQAGCEHQRALGWDNRHINAVCPTCGYKYGTAWLFEPVPASIIDELRSMA